MVRCPRCGRRLPASDVCDEHGRAPSAPSTALPDAPPARLPGRDAGPCLAIGGSAQVFALGDDAVVKWGRWHDAELRDRFAREARILRRLDGGVVPALLDAGDVGGWPYLVLERLRGPTLADALIAPADVEARLARWAAVVRAVEALHARGVAHGDLKPENVVEVGGAARLIDLGLAACPAAGEPGVPGGGTLHYTSPEQLAGSAATAAIDVYALGAVGFELLSGRPPFLGDRPTVEYGHALCRPPRLRELVAVPPELEQLVHECLAKDPLRRPGCAAVLERLARLTSPTAARAAAERPAARTERGPAVLVWVVAADRVEAARTLQTNHGRVLREHPDGTLAAFSWLDHDSPVAAAVATAHELARRGGAVVLHEATVLARRSSRAVRLYGDTIERCETWRPHAPWTGVLATPQICADGLAVEDSQTHPGFQRVLDEGRTRRSRVQTVPEMVARAPLVGDLAAAIAACLRDDRPMLATIAAESGMGKTRVLDEVRRALGREVATVSLAGAPAIAGRGATRRRLAEQLGDPHLLDGLHAAAARGTVLLVDDAQWIEDEVLDAIETAVGWPRGRLAVIVTASPDFARGRPRWGAAAEAPIAVHLPPLSDEAAQRMMRKLLLPALRVPTPLVERLCARAAGNPGALVAIGEEIERRGLVRRHPGGDEWYVAADELDLVQLQPSVRWRAARELAALPAGMAELLELCSALGPRFELREVEAVQAALPSGGTTIDPGAGLAWLARNGLLQQEHPGWRLASASLGEAIYAQIDPAARTAIHRTAFAHWSQQPAIAVDDGARLLRIAHHGGCCGEPAAAGAAYLALAQEARQRLAHAEAERMATRAILALDGVDAAQLAEALVERGRARCPLARYEGAREDLARAVALAQAAGDHVREAEAHIAACAVADFADWYRDAIAHIERAAALASRGIPAITAARLANWLGVIRFRQERLTEAEEALRHAVAAADEIDDHELRVGARFMLGAVLRRRGRVEDGLAALDRALALCRARGDYFHQTVGLFNRINYWRWLGHGDRAVEDCARAIELAELHGYGEAEIRGWLNLAIMRVHLAQPDQARAAARRAYATARRRYGDRAPAEPTLFLAAIEAGSGARADAARLLVEVRPAEVEATPWLRQLRCAVDLAVHAGPASAWSALDAEIARTDPEDRALITWLRARC